MIIPKDVITAIKQEAKISDIIGNYVILKKAGNSYKGLCPFHNEKTPSFSVSDELKMFHCFGCHESGDVFKFLTMYKNITYPEAVREVASSINFQIKEENFGKISKKAENDNIALKINNLASDVFHKKLVINSPAYKYLIKRGLDEHDITKFKLGYAPDSWDHILNYLRSCSYKDESIVYSGIVKRSDKNKLYDNFRNKIMFPIFNERDNVIAFGSRVLDNSLPKYINSADSGIFNKKKVLYGINLAKNHFVQKGHAIITEGYFDVIACHKFGFDTAVATLGTAVSNEHFATLSRHRVKDIFLVFDADEAGIKACFRAISIASNFDFNLKVITLDKGKDPMDFLLEKGREAFNEKMRKAISPINFVIDIIARDFDLDDIDSKFGYIKHVFSYINKLNNEIIKDQFLKVLSEKTGIEEKSVRSEFVKGQDAEDRVLKKDDHFTRAINKERHLLFVLLANPHLFKIYYNKIHHEFFLDEFSRKIFETVVNVYRNKGKYDVSEIENAVENLLDDEVERNFFTDELFKDIYINKPDVQIDLLLQEIKFEQIETRLNELKKAIDDAQKTGNEKESLKLLEEQQIVFYEKGRLKKAIQAVEKF